MNILETIDQYAKEHPLQPVFISGAQQLSWGALKEKSDRLAAWIMLRDKGQKQPFAVYGHKDPLMLVCFLACVKAGHAYCPIDLSVPGERVRAILESLPEGFVFAAEPGCAGTLSRTEGKTILSFEDIDEIANTCPVPEETACGEKGTCAENAARCVSGDGTWYIIFTSGSTGVPKGVCITADNLNHYLDWSVTLGSSMEEKTGAVFLNQAPFSFDLSVMDLYTCLACGGTLFCLPREVQGDYRLLMQALQKSGAKVWVSTPSFAQMCLSDPKFSEELLPELRVFLFCGETLANRTAAKLMQRFPKACVINTYGPTESTVAVTDVLITPELAGMEEALPVGKAKPGTCIRIDGGDGRALPDGEKGEILILGDTVSPGYFRQPELTSRAFFEEEDAEGGKIRGYRTGDAGWLKDGMLYYGGRIDLQVKLHGYRIELEDIENNLRRLPGVAHAVVLPNEKDGRVSSLTAYVVLTEDETSETGLGQQGAGQAGAEQQTGNEQMAAEQQAGTRQPGNGKAESRAAAAAMKEALRQFLPDYMIPRKILFLRQMPVTPNGKADRKKLREQVAKGEL